MKQQQKQSLKTRLFDALIHGLAGVGALYAPGMMPLGMSMFPTPGSTYLSDMVISRFTAAASDEQA